MVIPITSTFIDNSTKSSLRPTRLGRAGVFMIKSKLPSLKNSWLVYSGKYHSYLTVSNCNKLLNNCLVMLN